MDNLCEEARNQLLYEPYHEKKKQRFLPLRKQRRRSTVQYIIAQLISAFVFATRTLQILFFLNPKFQASSHFLAIFCDCMLVCVRPAWKFLLVAAHMVVLKSNCPMLTSF